MKDDLVVEGASEERMGMANEAGVGGCWRAFVKESFEWSGGAVEEEGTDGGGSGLHGASEYRKRSSVLGR